MGARPHLRQGIVAHRPRPVPGRTPSGDVVGNEHDVMSEQFSGGRARESRRSVAVVGAGVSGLTAAYLLQRHHDVTLYESDDRLGGHAHTHDVERSAGDTVPVDSGFIVSNERTYPLLMRLFADLGVRTRESEMSMSVRCD